MGLPVVKVAICMILASTVFTARCYAQRGYEIACRLSVRRPSVCLSSVSL